MYERVLEEMDKTCAVVNASGRLFMYAEDWIYAPAVTKTVEILKATKDKILFMKAEESHSGSHAAHAAQWSMTGGGSLIRMGCHPLSTVLYLKQVEARARGERIAVSAVTADVGNVAACLPPQDHAFIKTNPVDVEDWGMLTLTFSDGTKSTVFSGDMIMGGVRNLIETYTSGGSLFANITPNNHLMSYLTDEEKLAGVYITEKVDRKTGWQFVCLEEEWTRGYLQEIQDFMECVSLGRQPRADLALAHETIKINYAGYWSADEGRRIVACIQLAKPIPPAALAAPAAFDIFFKHADDSARHEDDEQDEKNAVDRVGGADEVGAETDAQSLVQRNRQQSADRRSELSYIPPTMAANTICSDTAMPETVSGLRYMKYCP